MDATRATAWGRELRLVHQRLRDALEAARDSIEDPAVDPGAIPTADLLIYCWGFCTALDGHHQSEDAAVFPLLLQARPDLEPVVRNLIQDHHMIGHLIGELRRAMDSGEPTDAVLRHLDGIEAVMETHFGYEERQIIAVLDTLDTGDLDRRQLFGPLG